MTSETKTTINHEIIKSWAENRNGKPATIAPEGMVGILKIDFPGFDQGEEKFRQITWDEFFEELEKKQLAFLFIEQKADGTKSNYYQLVKRAVGNESELKTEKRTTNQKDIMEWASRRGAIPSSIKGTQDEGTVAGILKFDFTGDESLEPLAWQEFFDKFEKEKLNFIYREMEEDGNYSHWYEFEDRI